MSAKIALEEIPGQIAFFCPGCACKHVLSYKPVNPNGWTWNGSFETPTFDRSVRWRGVPGNASGAFRVRDYVCHSYVRDGRIQFLDDCTHALKGQTVDLPDR